MYRILTEFDFLFFGSQDTNVGAQILISDISQDDEDGEPKECDDSFPDDQLLFGDDTDHQEQPDISEDREEGGGQEYVKRIDTFRFVNSHNTTRSDAQQIECSAAHNGAWTELTSLEALAHNLNDGEKDLRCRATEGHQGQVGYSVIPDANFDFFITFCFFFVCNTNGFSLTGDGLQK